MKQREMSPEMFHNVVRRILRQIRHRKIFLGKNVFFEPVEPRSEPQNRASKVAPKRNFLSKSREKQMKLY